MALDTFYLPKEAVSFVNYPVLREEQGNIETLMTFALRVHSALTDYNEARYDKIDVNMDEVETNINQCRATTLRIGTSDRIPFDVLFELRKIQHTLQNLRYLYTQQGKNLIGTPTTSTTSGGGL